MAHNPYDENGKLNRFFHWAFTTRANTVRKLAAGEMISPEKMFLSFTSHDPTFISHGPAGLNGSIKGIGFAPKKEYMAEVLEAYKKHIQTYDPADKTYSDRGLQVLMQYLYGDDALQNIDFTCVYSVEMAFKHSYENYQVNPEATLLFYQPPAISYELRGTMHIIGDRHDAQSDTKPEDLPIEQQFVNAQHDVYHAPNVARWKTRPVYKFDIEEIFDNSVTKQGFGTKIDY